jgi:hypothetical protein
MFILLYSSIFIYIYICKHLDFKQSLDYFISTFIRFFLLNSN